MAFKAIQNCPLLALMALAAEITVPSCSPDYFYFLSKQSSPKGRSKSASDNNHLVMSDWGTWPTSAATHSCQSSRAVPSAHPPKAMDCCSSSAGGCTPQRELGRRSSPPSWLAQGEHLTRSPELRSVYQSGHSHLR